MTSPPSSTTARWSFKLQTWRWAARSQLDALARSPQHRSDLKQDGLRLQLLWLCVPWMPRSADGGGFLLQLTGNGITAVAAGYKGLLFFLVFLVSVFHAFSYHCPRNFARCYSLERKDLLGSMRNPSSRVCSVSRTSKDVRARQLGKVCLNSQMWEVSYSLIALMMMMMMMIAPLCFQAIAIDMKLYGKLQVGKLSVWDRIRGRFFFFSRLQKRKVANLVCTVCVVWSPIAVFITVKENQ